MIKITETTHTKTLREVKKSLEDILQVMDKYKNCYFWSPRGNAAQRRREEFDEVHAFEFFGDEIKVELALRISCSNFYFTKNIHVNGNKSNATKLKNLIKKIDKIIDKRDFRK